ncbi:MAG: hypothetical protein ACLGI9_23975, partial [Thermoanaerobaculia bacterium]
TTAGGTTASDGTGTIFAPQWLKLVRSGNVFTAYLSPDGIAWTQVYTPKTVTMATTVHVGLVALRNGSTAPAGAARFDNVTVRQVSGVQITTPANGATVTSPFQVSAAESTGTANSMIVYLDNQAIYKVYETSSINTSVSAPPGTHKLVVKAWYSDGSSTTATHTFTVSSAPAVTITSPVSGGTYSDPFRVLAHENTSRNATSMQYVLDSAGGPTIYNTDVYDALIDAGPGTHTLIVKAWYSDGTLNESRHTFTVREGKVNITSPANGAIVSSPIRVVASEGSTLSATSMKVYLDDVLRYSVSNSDSVDTTITASSGAHELTVKAWYSDGTVAERRVNVTVP